MGKYDELTKFKELLDEGIISKADYEKKKEQILAKEDEAPAAHRGGAKIAAGKYDGLYIAAAIALLAYPLLSFIFVLGV
ncbi:SHOCT domain-containing protein [Candidatus Saccharibacteria bacterium]|nr:SHOCT domain-containing protein [Candidatus Saccharibacteria bacterium]